MISEEYSEEPTSERVFTVVNYKPGESYGSFEGVFQIEKRDAGTGGLLTGAEFYAYPFDSTVGEYDMDNGIAFVYDPSTKLYVNGEDMPITNLNRGKYLIEETKAPSGYAATFSEEVNLLTDNTKLIGDNAVLNYQNSLTIHKVDGDTNEDLAGVPFYIWKDGESEKEIITTGSDGNAVLYGLDPNATYYFEEAEAPDGYRGDPNVYSVAVGDNGYVNSAPYYTCTIKNYKYKGIVVTKKIKADDIVWENGEPTFLFTVTGKTKAGDTLTLNQAVTFTEDYVGMNTGPDGFVAQDITFEVPSGTYTVSEGETARYRLGEISQVTDGVIARDSAMFDLTYLESGSVTFVNEKYEWRDYSGSAKAINSFSKE